MVEGVKNMTYGRKRIQPSRTSLHSGKKCCGRNMKVEKKILQIKIQDQKSVSRISFPSRTRSLSGRRCCGNWDLMSRSLRKQTDRSSILALNGFLLRPVFLLKLPLDIFSTC